MTQEDFNQFLKDFDEYDFDEHFRLEAEDDYDETYEKSYVEVYMSSEFDAYEELDSPDELTYGDIKTISSRNIIEALADRGVVDLNGQSLFDDEDEPKLNGVNYFTVFLSTPWERYEVIL